MKKEEIQLILDKIKEGVKEAITEVYDEARKNGTKLVIAQKSGKVQWIEVK